ncbi:MAG: hypothetical protein AABO58_13105 [Acidobacteriota bacterium]
MNASATLTHDGQTHGALERWDGDLDEDDLAARDYAWFLGRGLLTHTDDGCLAFRDGYRAGGEIGRRRYAARARPRGYWYSRTSSASRFSSSASSLIRSISSGVDSRPDSRSKRFTASVTNADRSFET